MIIKIHNTPLNEDLYLDVKEPVPNYIGYLYFTINTITGMKYIGMHKHRKIDFKYIGSGKYLCNAIRKYGKKNFINIILEYFTSLDDLLKAEENLIAAYNASESKEFYNIAKGGKNCDNFTNNPRKEEIRQLLSIAGKGKQAGENNPMYGKYGEQHPRYGKHHTPEAKRKIGNANRGNTVRRGVKQTPEHIEKLRKTRIGRIPWNKGKKLNITPWNKGLKGIKCKKDLEKLQNMNVS